MRLTGSLRTQTVPHRHRTPGFASLELKWEAVTLFRYIYDPDMPQSESPKQFFHPVNTLARLKEAFEDSDLPILVDVLDWQEMSQSFRGIIPKDYAVLQKMPDGSSGSVARK